MDQFLRLNFTGPSNLEKSTKEELLCLKSDGNSPKKLTQGAKYLVGTLKDCKDHKKLARALVLQQSLFDSQSDSLKSKVFELYSSLESQPGIALEIARAHLMFGDLEESQQWMEKAQKEQKFIWTITGVTGKRTKHQQREAAQLVALAKSSNPASTSLEPCLTPREHNSETLLEKPTYTGDLPIEFQGVDPNTPEALNNHDAALMLLQAEFLIRSNPARDAAINEQVLAITDRIIFTPKNTVDWFIYQRALWLKSIIETDFEKNNLDIMQRGTLQMVDIVNGLHENDGANRLEYVHYLIPLPKWSCDIELAKRLVQIGGMQASAEIYDRLDLPVDAAVCLATAGESDKALAKINTYLEANSNDARAWSLKGDLTHDPKCWEKAWESGRYLTAKITLAKYYQQKKELGLAKQHLEEAAEAQDGILDVQFTLGCVDMQLQDFQGAEKAFSECVKIKPDESKCWSNLGAVFAQLGKLDQALHAFDRALKVDQNEEPNMRVWNNYILLACELRKWQIVVDAYKYMADAKVSQDKHINPSVLTQMTAAFLMNEYSGSALEKSFAQLMCEKLPKIVTGEPNLWRLAAKVNIWQNKPWDALRAYENGWQMVLENPDTSLDAFKKVVQWTGVLVDAYTGLGGLEGRMEGSVVCPDAKSKSHDSVKKSLARGEAYKSSSEYQRLLTLV